MMADQQEAVELVESNPVQQPQPPKPPDAQPPQKESEEEAGTQGDDDWCGLDRGRALFCLTKDNPLRRFCIALANNSTFDKFILLVIILSTVIMAMGSPVWYPENSSDYKILDQIDFATNVIFTLEMMIQIIAKGFVIGDNAYLQDGANKLDFAVVVSCWMTVFEVSGLPNLKPFRAFRALRALRAIKFLTYCTAILESLVSAMPYFVDVISLTGFLLIIFGIMGVQLFKCKMNSQCIAMADDELAMVYERWCDADLYDRAKSGTSAYTCPRGFKCVKGDNPNDRWTSFDNIYIAVFTIFQCSTLEGWTSIMYILQDGESEPAWLYMVIMILLFTYFVINLYCAVITMSFQQQRKKSDREAKERELAKKKSGLTVSQCVERAQDRQTFANAVASSALAGLGMAGREATTIQTNPLASDSRELQGSDVSMQTEMLELGMKPDDGAAGEMSAAGEVGIPECSLLEEARAAVVEHSLVDEEDPNPPDVGSELSSEARYGRGNGSGVAEEGRVEEEKSRQVVGIEMVQESNPLTPEAMEMLMRPDKSVPKLKGKPVVTLAERLEDSIYTEEFVETQLGGETCEMYRERKLAEGSWGCTIWLWYHADPLPNPEHPNELSDPLRFDSRIGHLLASAGFDGGINLAILFNIIFMAMEYHNMPGWYEDMLNLMEVVFAMVFLIEMLLKWIGYGGFKWYFEELSNCFDFVLVLSSLPTAAEYLFGTKSVVNLSMLRVFKLFRMFRLLRQMQDLIDTVISSIMAISNLIVFIMFAMVIFGIFGTSLFALRLFDGEGEVPRANFDNFAIALLTLFQIMTGEDWTDILYNTLRCFPKPDLKEGVIGEPACPSEHRQGLDLVMAMFMMLSFFIFSNYILLEMFTAVILENFELRADEKNNLQVILTLILSLMQLIVALILLVALME